MKCETCSGMGEATWVSDGRERIGLCPDCRPTLRDFAAMSALQGLLAARVRTLGAGLVFGEDDELEGLAAVSYRLADAMVRARGTVADDDSGETAAEVE